MFKDSLFLVLGLALPSASVATAKFLSDCTCEVSIDGENAGGASADFPLDPAGTFGGSGTLLMTVAQEHDGRCWLGEDPCLGPATWCNMDFTITITILPSGGDPVPDHIRLAGESYDLDEIGDTGEYTGTTPELTTPNVDCGGTLPFHVKVRALNGTVLTDNVIMILCSECPAEA